MVAETEYTFNPEGKYHKRLTFSWRTIAKVDEPILVVEKTKKAEQGELVEALVRDNNKIQTRRPGKKAHASYIGNDINLANLNYEIISGLLIRTLIWSPDGK